MIDIVFFVWIGTGSNPPNEKRFFCGFDETFLLTIRMYDTFQEFKGIRQTYTSQTMSNKINASADYSC